MSTSWNKPLYDLQQAFCAAILHEQDDPAYTFVHFDGVVPPAHRLKIYRNSTLLLMLNVMQNTFPATAALVGVSFFKTLALTYVKQYPPQEGCLLFYGAGFPDFLKAYPALSPHPYVADVARLEWLWQEAYHAEEGVPLTANALSAFEAEDFPCLVFTLHPSVRFVHSKYSVFQLWQAADATAKALGLTGVTLKEREPDAAAAAAVRLPDPKAGAEHVLLVRPRAEVDVFCLAPAAYELLTFLRAGLPLGEALEKVLIHAPDFDPQPVLAHCFAAGIFAGVSVV